MWRWEGVKMRRCEDKKMWRWEDVKMSSCEDEKMWRWEDTKIRRCEDEKMWRWEGLKMRRCEDEKMRCRPPLLEEPCAQTLSGKSAPNVRCFELFTCKCASRCNGVRFFISHLASGHRARRFSQPTFRPPEPQVIGKTQGFATFPPFRAPGSSFFWDFIFLIFFLLLFSSLLFFSLTLTLTTSAFHLSILSEVWLLNCLRQGVIRAKLSKTILHIWEKLFSISDDPHISFLATLGVQADRLKWRDINWPVSFHPAKSWPRPCRRTRAVADASGIDAFFNEPGEVRQVKCQRVHLLDT